jgi:hypothetical protein
MIYLIIQNNSGKMHSTYETLNLTLLISLTQLNTFCPSFPRAPLSRASLAIPNLTFTGRTGFTFYLDR